MCYPSLLPLVTCNNIQNLLCFTACVGSLVARDTSSGDSGKILDVYQLCNDSCDTNQLCTTDVKHGDLADVEELERILGRTDCRYKDLLQPCSTWEVKVAKILNMVRCRDFTERNPKKLCGPTRFCEYSMAFFDLDKECEYMRIIVLLLHILCSSILSYIHVWCIYPRNNCTYTFSLVHHTCLLKYRIIFLV